MYLHDIYEPDHDRGPHDHPWNFTSFILKGSYTEKVHPCPHVELSIGAYRRHWRQFTWHKMYKEWAHRIESVELGTRSLIFVGRRSRNWGFYVDGTWVPWQEYEGVS